MESEQSLNSSAQEEQKSNTISPQSHSTEERDLREQSIPTSHESRPTPHSRDKSCCCRYERSPRWKDWLEGIALLAGIGYAIVTYGMWNDAHDNFVANQRAWVGVTNPMVKGVEYVSGTTGIRGQLMLKNFGVSPALKVFPKVGTTDLVGYDDAVADTYCLSDKEWHDLQTADFKTTPNKRIKGNMVFPGQDIPWEFVAGGGMTAAVKPGDSVYVLGCLTYLDQFQKVRRTRFCLRTEAPPPGTVMQRVFVSVDTPFRRCGMFERAD